MNHIRLPWGPPSKPFARLAACLALALALTLAGLTQEGVVFRSSVDPGFPGDRSDMLEARGFPAKWWVDDSTHRAAALRPIDRFLAEPFLIDFLLALILAIPILAIVRRLLAAVRPKP